MAMAVDKNMQMLTEHVAIQSILEGVQDEMMVALLHTMQGAATTCARICIERLNALHKQMLVVFEETNKQQPLEITSFRGECWEDLDNGTQAVACSPERQADAAEPSLLKGRAAEHDVMPAGPTPLQEGSIATSAVSEVGLSPAKISTHSAMSPPAVAPPSSTARQSMYPEATKAHVGGVEAAERTEKRRPTAGALAVGGSLVKTGMESGGRLARSATGVAQKATGVTGSMARSGFNMASKLKRAASSAASTVQGRSPEAFEKTAGFKEFDEAEATESLQQPQDEWWGTGDSTSSSAAINDRVAAQPPAGGTMNAGDALGDTRPAAQGSPLVQNFSLSDGESSSEEETNC